MTQLTTLGGSAAGVGTGQGCSGYLVQTSATTLVIDLGPGTLLELRKHTDYRRLDAIVISHLHLDHVLDLMALRFTLAYNPQSPPAPVPLYLPPNGLAFMRRAAETFAAAADDIDTWFSTVFEMQEYDPAQQVVVGDLTLTFAPTAHVIPCWAIRVHPADGTGDLFYTADTGTAADLSDIAAGATVVIAEAAAPPDTDPARIAALHLTPQQAAHIAAQAGAEHLVLTHIFEENGAEAFAAVAREHFAGDITIAKPGATVTW